MKYWKHFGVLTMIVVWCSACVTYKVQTYPHKRYYLQSSDTVYLAGFTYNNPQFGRQGTDILDNTLEKYAQPITITTSKFGTLLYAKAVGYVPDVIDTSFLRTLNAKQVRGYVLKCTLVESDEDKRLLYIEASHFDRFNPDSYRKDPSSLFIFSLYDIANGKLVFTCRVRFKHHSLKIGQASGYDTNLNLNVNESFPSGKFKKAIKKFISVCDFK